MKELFYIIFIIQLFLTDFIRLLTPGLSLKRGKRLVKKATQFSHIYKKRKDRFIYLKENNENIMLLIIELTYKVFISIFLLFMYILGFLSSNGILFAISLCLLFWTKHVIKNKYIYFTYHLIQFVIGMMIIGNHYIWHNNWGFLILKDLIFS